MKDSPQIPQQPNYGQIAQQQGQANIQAAQAAGIINNPNYITPYGSQTVSWGSPMLGGVAGGGSGGTTFDQNGYNAAMQKYQSDLANYNQQQAQMSQVPSGDSGFNYIQPASSGAAPIMPTQAQFTTTTPASGGSFSGDTSAPSQASGSLANYNAPSGIMQPTVTQTLSPAQQQLLDAQNAISLNLANLGQSQLGRVSSTMGQPLDTSGIGQIQTGAGVNPNYTSNVNYNPLQSSYGSGGNIQYGPNYNGQIQNQIAGVNPLQSSVGNTGNIQSALNMADVAGIPQASDAARMNAENTAYQAATARLDPYWQQQQTQQIQYLANQGVVPGTQAFDNAMRVFNQGKNDAYQQAQAAAVQQGLASQQAQFGMGLAANQAGYNEALGQGQFANAAQQQAYNQALSNAGLFNQAQGQQFAQNQAMGQFANQAQQQAYNQALQNAGFSNAAQAQANAQNQAAANFYNTAQQNQFQMGLANANLANQVGQQQFTQGLQNAALNNAAVQQQLQQAAYLRQLPLNELNALRTGAQVQNPQFAAYSGQGVQAAPLMQAAQNQAAANQGLYNAQVGQQNAFNSGLFSLGAAAVPFLF